MSDETLQISTPKKRPRWAKAFLSTLAETGNVRLACEMVDIDRRTAYDLRKRDDTFVTDWESALEEAADTLEKEARRRAHDGVQRLKFDRGKPIMVPVIGDDGLVIKDENGNAEMIPYIEHEYSDTLLIFLLKAANPEKYRERTDVRHSGKIDVSKLSDDELRAITEG